VDQKPASGPEEAGEHRRESSRVRLYLPAKVQTTFDQGRAAIYNVSCTGAQVTLDAPPRMGSDLLLKSGSIDVLCTIVWVKGNVCGLEFDEPLSEEEVVSLRRLADNQSELQHAARNSAAKDWSEGR
jgi:hypothetical protein